MNKKHEEYLYKKYPKLYRQHVLDMSETALCWGLQCGSGWFKILDKLSAQITKVCPTAEATTVKEKLGSLRVYLTKEPKAVHELIQKAADESYRTCEECGKPGVAKADSFGWISVLCKKCRKKEGK